MKLRLFWFIVLLLSAGVAQAVEIAANIVFTVGTVTIENVQGGSRPAVQGGELNAGETIATAADGRVQLKFRDGATLSLNPSSRFRVDDYRYSGQPAQENRGFFSLLRGGFRTVTGLIGKQYREQYRVKTSVATIGIRGTVFTANMSDDGLRVNTVQGLVEVCSDVACILIGQGQGTHVPAVDRKPILIGDATAAVPDTLPPGAPTPPPSADGGISVESAPQQPARAAPPPAHQMQGSGGSYPGGYQGGSAPPAGKPR